MHNKPDKNCYDSVENQPKTSLNNEKIYVAGHSGMVGSAIVRVLDAQGQKYSNSQS